MKFENLEIEIKKAVPLLLDLARQLTWNKISDNCTFILTEIENSSENFHSQRRKLKKINDRKKPQTLAAILPRLQAIFDDLYDINLYIYKAHKQNTVIDIRYYRKNLLEAEYRKTVLYSPPMIHCKVSQPPWLAENKPKFDINWEHKEWITSWKLFWAKRKLEAHSG